MKRLFANLLAVCLLMSFWLPAQATDKRITVPMRAVQLGPHSYYLQSLAGAASATNQGFMSNAGFVVTRDGVVVFDALASPPLAERFVKIIRSITRQPIKRVIVSHYHADHYYGLQVFKALGAEIWAQEGARGVTDSEAAATRLTQRKDALFPWVDDTTRLLPPDRYLKGDEDFEMGGVHFSLRHVGPAHSAEDMAMFVREDGVLYAGDLIFKGRIPFVGDADSASWLAALDTLLELKPRILVPGHGQPSRDPATDLVFTRDYLNFVRTAMGRAVADFIPFDAAYAATDWSRYASMPAFAEANRVNAYNQYLRLEQEALKAP
jgi:glyoxylase-like metal-dependent hydrolase (beta-lactamase superfamily II)